MNEKNRTILAWVFSFAFTIRVVFSLYIQFYLYGEFRYTDGDSYSFTSAFLNLYYTGHYTFDITHPDASFFRGPIYPFFWGLHYLIFGPAYVYQAVAVSQCVIDSLSALLIFAIATKLGAKPSLACVGAIVHGLNPFQIIWVPISHTEVTATFMALLLVYVILLDLRSNFGLMLLGTLIGIAVLLRQYLGVFIIAAVLSTIYTHRSSVRGAARSALVVSLGFCVALSPWVLRNWINHGEPYVLIGETRGYYSYGPDAVAFESMFNKLDENITPYFDDASAHGRVDLSQFNLTPDFEKSIHDAVTLAHQCGSSFLAHGHDFTFTYEERDKECERRIITEFERLRKQYRETVGFFQYNATRLDALEKAFFVNTIYKYSFENPYIVWAIKTSFFLRSVVIIIAFLSIIYLNWPIIVALFFPAFMFIYIPVVTIHVEVRYLIQADAILLALFSFVVNRFWCSYRLRYPA